MRLLVAAAGAALAFAVTAGVAQADPLKVCFVYVGPHNDGGYSQQHDMGRQMVAKELGDKVDASTYLENVQEADAETPIGWVSSVATGSDARWVASLFVHPDYRRRGIGKSLMSAMLNEDARCGVAYSALLASQTGALLYPHLGYEQHGVLLLFHPPR